MFVIHPPSWKLKDSQRGWSPESTPQLVETTAEVVIPDSDIDIDSDKESIPDGYLMRDHLLNRYWKKSLLVNFSSTKDNGLMTAGDMVSMVLVIKIEVDRGNGRKPYSLNVSKHAVKELTYEEIKEMAKEMRIGNAGYKEHQVKNKAMEGEEEEKKKIAWNHPCDNRTLTDLIICIILNRRVMIVIRELEKE